MLQVALDNQSMSSAYETTRLIADEVDIIEVGTILCVAEGVRAVRDLKALYPNKIVLADAKIADAGKILSRMCFEANADWVTVICCADINTTKGALDVAKEFNGDVQIELTGYWTWEQAQEWREAGVQQVVYHRSRDAQAAGVAWGEADISAIKRLSGMGFKVTVTGGLALEDLPLFQGIPIHVFIAGRSIRDAASRWKPRGSLNVRSPSCGAKERLCCRNLFRSASMKKRSPPGSAGWNVCGWLRRSVLISSKCRSMKLTPAWPGSTGAGSSASRWLTRLRKPGCACPQCA
jgi:3-dehydro-L-gulonate-6-phosphate decarboxylase